VGEAITIYKQSGALGLSEGLDTMLDDRFPEPEEFLVGSNERARFLIARPDHFGPSRIGNHTRLIWFIGAKGAGDKFAPVARVWPSGTILPWAWGESEYSIAGFVGTHTFNSVASWWDRELRRLAIVGARALAHEREPGPT
jgi:hypothetical protein